MAKRSPADEPQRAVDSRKRAESNPLNAPTYRALINALPVGVAYIGADRHCGFLNKVGEEWLGRDPTAVEGRHVRDVLDPHRYEQLRPFLDSALEGRPAAFEGILQSANGESRRVKADFVPHTEADGPVRGAFLLIDDRPWQTMARQSLVFENMNDAVIITDLDGRVTDWNPGATRTFGYEREEMLGRTVTKLYDLKDPRALETEVIAEMARSGRWAGELRFRRKDGSAGICETAVVPLRDHTGRRVATVGVNRDVTERTGIETDLARSHALLEAIAEGTTDAIFVKDLQGRYLMMNRSGARFLGKPAEEVLGKNDGELFAPDEAEAMRQIDRRVMESGIPSTIEEEVTFLGTSSRLMTNKAPWRDAAGTVIGLIGIARDVTDSWQAQQLAQQRQTELAHVLRVKTLGEMAASLAHELNQPLAAVTNYARGCILRMKDQTATVGDLLPVMEEMSEQTIRASNVVRRLHGLVRRQPARQEKFDLTELVRGAIQLAEAELRRARITLQTQLGPPLYVEGDSIQIEQVVLNLVKNAAEAMPEGGCLVIESGLAMDNSAEVSVSDTGPGLTEEQLRTVFDPFITTKPDALGMGLAISRTIAEAHRGRLSGSTGPNGGATFRLLLPRSEEHQQSDS